MKILILILVVSIIVGVVIIINQQPSQPTRPDPSINDTSEDFPPKPKWKPTIPVDIERIVNTFRYYSNNKITFAIFENGTCVPIDGESEQPEQEALIILDQLFHQHPDFKPLAMDDGNWMVSYSDKAYSICFANEVESNWETIDSNHLEALATDEVLLDANQQPNVFNKTAKIGLFARARWFMDCQNPRVVKIIRPSN